MPKTATLTFGRYGGSPDADEWAQEMFWLLWNYELPGWTWTDESLNKVYMLVPKYILEWYRDEYDPDVPDGAESVVFKVEADSDDDYKVHVDVYDDERLAIRDYVDIVMASHPSKRTTAKATTISLTTTGTGGTAMTTTGTTTTTTTTGTTGTKTGTQTTTGTTTGTGTTAATNPKRAAILRRLRENVRRAVARRKRR